MFRLIDFYKHRSPRNKYTFIKIIVWRVHGIKFDIRHILKNSSIVSMLSPPMWKQNKDFLSEILKVLEIYTSWPI